MTTDPVAGVGLLAALFAGLVSFLSPCVLPLVPGYLAAVTGVSPERIQSTPARRVLGPSLLFVLSFSVIFVILGLSATGVGRSLGENRQVLEKVAAALIVAMGLFFVATLFVARLNREWRIDALMARAGRGGPLVAGVAFAIAWTPCVGPTLGAILSAAALSESVGRAGLLLGVYSAGLAIPFLLTAVAFARMTRVFDVVKRNYRWIMASGGAVLVAMGVLIWTGELFRLNIEAQRLLDEVGLNFFADV
jgi:cytochrome c-type biogenesis protein